MNMREERRRQSYPKPTISVLCPYWIQVPRMRWQCRVKGQTPVGTGFTPELAYKNWQQKLMDQLL